MEVIRATSRRHDPSLTYPNNLYGYGEIDAYAGLLHILGLSQVENLSRHMPSGVRFSLSADRLRLTFDSDVDRPVTVRVYTAAGVLVATHQATPAGRVLDLPAGEWVKGVYAVQVNGPDSATTGSTLVRR